MNDSCAFFRPKYLFLLSISFGALADYSGAPKRRGSHSSHKEETLFHKYVPILFHFVYVIKLNIERQETILHSSLTFTFRFRSFHFVSLTGPPTWHRSTTARARPRTT